MGQSQAKVLEALLSGASVTDAAAAGNVSRRSVHRWMRDAVFVAALNQARNETARAAKERLRGLVSAALDAVAGAVKDPDPKLRAHVGLKVLEGVGLLGGKAADLAAPLEEDPERVRRTAAFEAATRRRLDDAADALAGLP